MNLINYEKLCSVQSGMDTQTNPRVTDCDCYSLNLA